MAIQILLRVLSPNYFPGWQQYRPRFILEYMEPFVFWFPAFSLLWTPWQLNNFHSGPFFVFLYVSVWASEVPELLDLPGIGYCWILIYPNVGFVLILKANPVLGFPTWWEVSFFCWEVPQTERKIEMKY